jgi:uncharacterized protein (DUF433 family)
MAVAQHPRISVDPGVMVGKPCIKGTRITVELILRKIAGGMTPEAILQDHPHLNLEDVRAAVRYAADIVANEDIEIAS